MRTIRLLRRWAGSSVIASIVLPLLGALTGAGPATAAIPDAQPAARRRALPLTSVVRYRQVEDFAADGEGPPTVIWSDPIEVRVEGRELVRVRGAERTVLATGVLTCRAGRTSDGRVRVDVLTPRQAQDGSVVLHLQEVDLTASR